MREVMISIQPKWVEKICRGEKTVEVRKTRPKCETPFKVYIYCTMGKLKTDFITKSEKFGYITGHEGSFYNRATEYDANGKVIGEFVCDKIYDITPHFDTPTFPNQYICGWDYGKEFDCLSFEELTSYLNGKKGYGWHITDLVVYDEPRELRDFKPYNRTEEDCKFSNLGLAIPKCKDCRECYVKRPYQSWGYVEATEPQQTAD